MNEVRVGIVEGVGAAGSSITFSGDLIFGNIQGVKAQIDSILSDWKNEKLNMEISEVASFDLSFLQLLETITNHLVEKKIELNIDWDMDDETRLLLQHTGFEKYTWHGRKA